MVDETLILRKLSELSEYLGQIREFKNITVYFSRLTPIALRIF
jgi:hypothetical protein